MGVTGWRGAGGNVRVCDTCKLPIFHALKLAYQVLNKSHYVARYRSLFAFKRFLFELLQQALLLVILILFTPLMCSVDQNLYASTGVSPAIQVGLLVLHEC